ncbi:MAG: Nif11-like leader peptide family natural product precursor [Parachlamydiaceae bacterium]|nr:Nif11-like leader peptide family natural product precursor [Parachlamydiaceae bacterium]
MQLNNFFSKITADSDLQARLYETKEIADVSIIAKEIGFNVSAAELLRAQAGRVLSLPPEELEFVAAGQKSKSGAQWGRGGKGYLDSPGYWIIKFIEWEGSASSKNPLLASFLNKIKIDNDLQVELLAAKNHNDVSIIANKNGFKILGSALLLHQASQILKLAEEKAEEVAKGAS